MKECIIRVVNNSSNLSAAMNHPILNLIFTELCSDTKSEEFLRYLFRDLFLNKFPLERLDVKIEPPTKADVLDKQDSSEGFSTPKEVFEDSLSSSEDSLDDSCDTNLDERLASLVSLIWKKFYLGDQIGTNEKGKLKGGQSFDGRNPVSCSAPCRLIPSHIIYFCQTMQIECERKFGDEARSIATEFLFDRWIV